MAMRLSDEDERISSLAKLFFHELSKKGSTPIYNLLPDILGRLSNQNLKEEAFHNIMHFLIGSIKKDKQMEALVEKLCNRFSGVTGFPAAHFSYVKNIEPGLPLFLFNYSDRKLHGIFESASKGQMLINPYGWIENGTERTPYPAQVRICVRTQCKPLQEKQFGPIIRDNFYTANHFWFELDHSQADRLLLLFTSTSKGGPRVNLPSHLPHTWQSSGNVSCSLEPSGRTGPFFYSKEESADWGQANQRRIS